MGYYKGRSNCSLALQLLFRNRALPSTRHTALLSSLRRKAVTTAQNSKRSARCNLLLLSSYSSDLQENDVYRNAEAHDTMSRIGERELFCDWSKTQILWLRWDIYWDQERGRCHGKPRVMGKAAWPYRKGLADGFLATLSEHTNLRMTFGTHLLHTAPGERTRCL